MEKTRLIIDNDAGSDDACAIAICLRAEHCIVEVNIYSWRCRSWPHTHSSHQALTVVDGNVPVKQGLRNMRVLVAALGLHGPNRPKIYSGAEGPLIQHPGVEPFRYHFYTISVTYGRWNKVWKMVWSRGRWLWRCDRHVWKRTRVRIKRHHHRKGARGKLSCSKGKRSQRKEWTHLYLGDWSLDVTNFFFVAFPFFPYFVAIRNIALAIRLDPGFLSNVKEIMIMGCSLLAKGNAGLAAEFNFHCDPEAGISHFFCSTLTSIRS